MKQKHSIFRLTAIALVISFCSIVSAQVVPPTNLNDSVPYQGDTLLFNPLPMMVHDTNHAYLDCDWNTLMSMIRDLEERIAGALEVDTAYDVYVSGQVIDQRIFMDYDCLVLRDSVISLQIQLDDALLGPPSVLSQAVMSILQRTASIKAKVTDDGGAAMRIWGVFYGKQDWWVDSLSFFAMDSLIVEGGSHADYMDSLTADRFAAYATAMQNWNQTDPQPIITAMDTSILNVDSVFTRAITGLERYTNYIAIPIAANDSLMTELSQSEGPWAVEGSELNAGTLGLFGVGDTLMFKTLADTASGFTLDTASVTSVSARLLTSINDAGGQGPDAVQFQYDTLDFTAATFAGDSISSDSTGGTSHSAVASGLTRYTDYYFRAFADNVQGRGNSESSMTFKTLPELPEVSEPVWQNGNLSAQVTDLGGDNGAPLPSSVELNWGTASDLTGASDSTVTFNSTDSTFNANLPNLSSGAVYYARSKATNIAGTGQSTIGSFTTLVGLTTDSIESIAQQTGTVFSTVTALNAAPSQVSYSWSENADLTAGSDSSKTYTGAQNQLQLQGLDRYTTYYVAANASNNGGTSYGDTLSFITLPDLPTFDTLYYDGGQDSLISILADNGGQSPTAQAIAYANNEAFTSPTDLTTGHRSDTITAYFSLLSGQRYYAAASATNNAGVSTTDTILFETLPEVTTLQATLDLTDTIQALDAHHIANGYDSNFLGLDSLKMRKFESVLGAGSAMLIDAQLRTVSSVNFPSQTSNPNYGISIAYFEPVLDSAVYVGDTVTFSDFRDIRTEMTFEGSSFYRSAVPSAYGFIYGDSQLTNAADTAATAYMDSTFITHATGLTPGTRYWYAAYATTLGGTAYGDTLYAGATGIATTTDTAEVVSNESVILMATGDYSDALPDSVGFIWSTNADFSDADTVGAYLPSAGIYTWKDTLTGLSGGDEIFYTSFAQNARGTTSGDTLSAVTKVKLETLPLLASTDTSATFGGKLLEFMDLVGHPDSVGFEWSTTDADMTDSSDSLFVFDVGTLAADSTYTLELPFQYGTLVWYRFFAINEGGTQHGQTIAFCSGACPETMDYLGETYPIVRLGCDCYFAENLRAVQYISGDSITQVPVHNPEERIVFDAYEIAIAVLDTTIDRSVNGVYYNGRMISQSYFIPSLALCPPGWSMVDLDGLKANVEPLLVFDEDDQYPGITGEGDSITSSEANNAIFRRMKSTPLDDPAWDGSNAYGLSVFPTGFYIGNGERYYGTSRAYLGGYKSDSYGNLEPGVLDFASKPSGAVTATSTLSSNNGSFGLSATNTNSYPVRCQITGIETPPTIITQNATGMTADGARLNAAFAHPGWKTTSELATVSDRGFVIASNPGMTDSTMISLGIGGSDTIYWDFTDAVENQEYWFQPYATNQFSNMDSAASVGYGQVYSFIAMVPEVPTVQTMPIRSLRQQRWGKTNNLWKGKLMSKNSSEVESATWSWYRAASPSDVKDSTEILTLHSEVEDLVLGFDSTYSLNDEANQATILDKDLQPGAEYHYFASVTNGVGTGYGDTLSVFVPMLIQPWSTTTTDSSVTIDGKVYWNDGNINEMGIVLQTEDDDDEVDNFIEGYDDDKYVYLDQYVLTSAFDTVPITPNPDSTFSVTIDLDQSNIGDFINYQIFATNTHAEADSTLMDTSYSQIQYFTMGACPTIDYEGYTYETQRINGKCWFTSNLRVVTYANGDSIQFGGTQAGLTPGILDTLQSNPIEGLGAYFFPDSAYLNDYGLLYSRSVMAQQADTNSSRNVCPVGTHFVTIDELNNLVNEGSLTYRYENYHRQWGYNAIEYIGRHYTDERYGGTNTSRLTINGGRLSASSWYTDTTDHAILKSEVALPFTNGTFGNLDDYYIQIAGFVNDKYEYVSPNASDEFKSAYPMRCIVDEPTAGPDVVTAGATDVTGTGATLNATYDFEGWRGANETGFTWGYEADLSDGVDLAGDTLSGPFSAELSVSLETESRIYFRAFAKDSFGNESTGDIESVCLLNCPTVTFDGHEYQTVAIDCQCWFAENLLTTVYADGSAIPEVTANESWADLNTGARCDYDNVPDSAAIYGRLYNWHAVDSAAGLCPSGWHVPTNEEWQTLDVTLGASDSGAQMKASASDSSAWNGTNSSGWSGLPGGFRAYYGAFMKGGTDGTWWTSNPTGDLTATARELLDNSSLLTSLDTDRRLGSSVRCLRDTMSAPVVSTVAASSVTETTATLNGTVDFNWAAMTATGFKWGYEADLSDATDASGDTLAGDFSADLTGLVTNDSLYFTAYATNALGTTYGDTLIFKNPLSLIGEIDGAAWGDASGSSVSLSSDGTTVAIGSPYNDATGDDSGHVRIYARNGLTGDWVQQGADIDGEATGDNSGNSVSLSSGGTVVAIGAFANANSGHVRIYSWNGLAGAWVQLGDDIDGEAVGDGSGYSVSLSSDGTRVAIGANGNGSYSGHVRIYSWNSGTIAWEQQGADIDGEAPGDNSGNSVSLSSDGTTVAIGANGNGSYSGHVRIYSWNSTTSAWEQQGDDIDGEATGDNSGNSVSLSSDGTVVAIGARMNDGNGNNSGHTRIYSWNSTTSAWDQQGADIDGEAANDQSGSSVSLSSDGTTVAIGAKGNDGNGSYSGHVRIYSWNSTTSAWEQQVADIDGEAEDDSSGWSVSLSSDGTTVCHWGTC